jgi:hypothetical protein
MEGILMSNATEVVAFPAAKPAPSADLSAEIVKKVKKEPGDRVTCRRIAGDNYRCNWWAAATAAGYDNPSMSGLTVTTHRVRQSRFLCVVSGPEGLVITERN